MSRYNARKRIRWSKLLFIWGKLTGAGPDFNFARKI